MFAYTRAHSRAFTLIELLIVLVIITIITAVSVLAFGSMGRSRHEQIITHQFARTVSMAQQQAIFESEVLELIINNQGYYFLVYRNGKWSALHYDVFSQRKIFHSRFQIKINHIFVSKNENAPPILFLPSGFVTPFVLQLQDGKNKYIINPNQPLT